VQRGQQGRAERRRGLRHVGIMLAEG
jgi:hypothetical protein